MTQEEPAAFVFTKLVVDDVDAMADYYCTVFGLHRGTRDRFDDGVGGEPIDEIALTAKPGEKYGALTLLKFTQRPAVKEDETILGFTTPDLSTLLERVQRAGGDILGPIKEYPDHGIRVAFARDPEGHLNELVELRA
ncbi:MAG: VOC family protein [Deltaproteobacteria bacterium]|jgi:predicted enzyme related to lactoylglutathione lyase|nr:VOC family protein [Deltaproteobacteria bacterium]MBW2497752.1 VOC family protein [Deltaproteobacteria bacterium]